MTVRRSHERGAEACRPRQTHALSAHCGCSHRPRPTKLVRAAKHAARCTTHGGSHARYTRLERAPERHGAVQLQVGPSAAAHTQRSLPALRGARSCRRLSSAASHAGSMFGASAGGRPQDYERVARTVHVGGIGGLGETISEQDVADFFGQQGACGCRSRHDVPSQVPLRVGVLGSLTAPAVAFPGEVTAVRISGRFCWVEFADVRAAHAALECVPEATPLHNFAVPQRRPPAPPPRNAARPPRADWPCCAQAGRHGDRRPPPACVAEQVCHSQQRPQEAGARRAPHAGQPPRAAHALAVARRLRS